MARKRLTDRTLKALKQAMAGSRYDVMDVDVSGLGVRVNDKGLRTFVLIARYRGSKNPTRRALGEYPTLSLEKAREKARIWRDLIRAGKDPKEEEREENRRQQRRLENSVAAVAEKFLERHVKGQRQARDTERAVRREVIARWGQRPLDSITRRDVIAMVEEIVDRGAPAMARNVLAFTKIFFKWCVSRDLLDNSPAALVEAKALIGEKKVGKRVLADDEIIAFWDATERMGYPFGPLFRMLLLTGCRVNEIARARWREIDAAILTIPPERFKSDAQHLVPLTKEALAVLNGLPRFTQGDHLFSTTFGEKAVSGFSKAKKRLDQLMGSDEPFKLHDLRRTVRTRLASLKVPDTVAEMVIGHGKRGLGRVYDQHRYLDEIREALELWAGLLRDIVTPPPENIVRLEKATA
jgi:integrase